MRLVALLGAVLLCACGASGPPAPVIQSLAPAQARTSDTTSVAVQVELAFPVTFDYSLRAAQVDTRVAVSIAGSELMVESVEPGTVTVVVAPGLPVGKQDVRLTLPDGREAVLPQGFEVLPAPDKSFTLTVPDTVTAGVPFLLTIQATGPNSQTFVGTVQLLTKNGTLQPPVSGAFTAGQWSGMVTIDKPGSNWITARDTAGTWGSGTSAPFPVNSK